MTGEPTTGNVSRPRTPDEVDRITYPMQQLHIHQVANQNGNVNAVAQNQELTLPLLRHQPYGINYQAMSLHRTKGRNVRFCGGNRSVAMRTDTEFCQGYVFTARPLQIAERIVVQILATEPMFQGCLGLGKSLLTTFCLCWLMLIWLSRFNFL